ncbi:energy transducer TonB [Chitinibacter bivalviorum]|uniref:Energy transducer TonB n=1 Tax=Chitinibacter bivalviorum TaxID=2739434 RepID=A0A7H9BF58_9NEIS|nr:energy transducer TonB [Chitinibacter bivalviorum]QLG87340.1 energy transducer TonB [Chitinibacter bivalviorum]
MILDNKKILCGVVVLHAAMFYQLSQSVRPQSQAEPLMMQAIPLAMGDLAPEPKPEAQKPLAQPKQKMKTVKQKVQERVVRPAQVAKTEAQTQTPERSATLEVAAAKANQNADNAEPTVSKSRDATEHAAAGGQEGVSKQVEPTVSAPSFHANYLSNPKPPYPPASLALGEQGVVMLRVAVSPAGLPEKIDLAKSSGYSRLDAVAQSTVLKWRFVPAKRGDEAVAGTVVVPVNFSIKKS